MLRQSFTSLEPQYLHLKNGDDNIPLQTCGKGNMGPSSKAWQRAQSPVGAHPPELLGAGCGEFHATADGKALCKLNSSAVGMFVSISLPSAFFGKSSAFSHAKWEVTPAKLEHRGRCTHTVHRPPQPPNQTSTTRQASANPQKPWCWDRRLVLKS